MAEGPGELSPEEIDRRVAALREQMRPLEQGLAEVRAERDLLLTELRRRQRLAHKDRRAGVRAALRAGELATVAELVAGGGEGSFDEYDYNLKTGGAVRLGFPGARTQTVAFTDGRQVAQARGLRQAAELYAAGWEAGVPGRPGLRVHFTGTRQEKLAAPDEVFARLRPEGSNP